ncbi:MAG: hypothetical protein JJU20_01530 [Opitutales bacterium]|nr:hypothetical protein [Opitutales bacterium]
MSASSSKPCFRVEGLEARILLSAAPVDGGIDAFDEPDVFERVEVDDALLQQAHSGPAGDDGLWDGAGDNEAAAFAGEDQLILESGSTDPFAGLEVSAPSVIIGDSVWSGDNVIFADSIEIVGELTAKAGATLTLIPSSLDAGITLGKYVEGFALGSDELQRLAAAGFAELVIGSQQGSHRFTIDGLSYQGNLSLQAPVDGGGFDVLSKISHSGGQLTFIGPGATQNTSADTENEGEAILINDSVQLVYTEDNQNTIRMVTTHNGHPNGADITITGDILGSDEGRGGHLILDAGNQGTIFIGGSIGTSAALETLEIINAREVIISGNVQVDALLIRAVQTNVTIGSGSSNFLRIDAEKDSEEPGNIEITAANNITVEGDLEVIGGDAIFNITGSTGGRQLWFKGEVSLSDGDFTIERAARVLMSNDVSISGHMTQVVGLDSTLFEQDVIVGSMDLTATNQIRFEGQLDMAAGDLRLTTNNIDFRGGDFTVIGALEENETPVSNAYFRPFSAAGNMNIGAPIGAGTNFTFSTTDIAALAEGWQSITFGYETGSTNLARVGTAEFLDQVTMYAGSFLINGPLSAKTSLDLNAATGNIDVRNGANIRVTNQELDEVFQSSRITFLAQEGDIEFRNAARLIIANEDDSDSAQGSLIEMEATNGRIVDLSASPNRQEARELHLLAANAITLSTEVAELTAQSTSGGSISINELSGLYVHSAITANGAISITSGGLTILESLQSSTSTTANTISVTALGSIAVGELLAGTQGHVNLTAEGSIIRLEADPQDPPLAHLIQGNHLSLSSESGQGQTGTPLETRVNRITSTNSDTGVVRIEQLAGRQNLTLSVINESEGIGDYIGILVASGTGVFVHPTGMRSESSAGISLTLNGGAIQVEGDVTTTGGSIAFKATQNLNQLADTSIESNGGDILLDFGTGVTMAASASVESGAGNIVILGGTGNISLGVIDARIDDESTDLDAWGNIALFTSGRIQDISGSDSINLYANELQLVGENGVGLPAVDGDERTVETMVNRMAVAVSQSSAVIAIHNQGDLRTGVVAVVDLDLIDFDGDAYTFSGQSPPAGIINAGGGHILIQVDGLLVLESNDAESNSVAVRTQGNGRIVILAGSLLVEDAILSNGGSITIQTSENLEVAGTTAVSTSGSATVALESESGNIFLGADTLVFTGTGSIVIAADSSITLGTVETTGSVGLRTDEGSIRSASGGDNDRVVITADSLAIVAEGLVNGSVDSGSDEAGRQLLLTHIATLSLAGVSGSHYRIHNSRSLNVSTTSARADSYNNLMELSDLEVEAQDSFIITGQGDIELLVDGNATLAAERSIRTTGSGSINFVGNGSFTMGTLSDIQTDSGAIQISADGTAAIARVESEDGNITVSSANGAIIDSDPEEVTVVDFATEGQLTLVAENGIGIESGQRDTLSVLLGTLNASSVNGGIFITSAESFAINGLETTGTLVPVSVLSEGSLNLSGTTDVTGDLVLRADEDLHQTTESLIRSGSDLALQAGGDMILYRVATPANVALEVDGGVMGYSDPQHPAIEAAGLLLNGVGSVGSPAQPLVTEVDRIAGQVTSGALALVNEANLTVGLVETETTPVGSADTLPAAESRVQSANRLQISGQGLGVFIEVQGDWTTEAVLDPSLEVMESIPVLVQSTGEQTWNGHFDLAGGLTTLRSDAAVALLADAAFITSGGSLLVEAGGSVEISADSELTLGGADLMLDSGSSILLHGHITAAGNSALIAGQSVTAGSDSLLQATDLVLRAGSGIGGSNQSLITEVSHLSVLTGPAGVFIENEGDLRVTNLAFTIPSLSLGGIENIAYSGAQGGIIARAGGAVQVENNGQVIIDPSVSTIVAFPNTNQTIVFIADESGPDFNGAEVVFEIVRSDDEPIDASTDPDVEDLRDGNPPTTLLLVGENTIDLRVFVRDGVSTLAEIVDAINAEGGFPWTVILVSGEADGSTVFSWPQAEDSNFFSSGGSESGIQSQVAATLSGGSEAVSATAGILFPERSYTIIVSANEAGAEANDFFVRILDEGPIDPMDGGRLNPNTNAAVIEWDGGEYLDIYINYGYTTIGAIIDRINTQEGIPFSAQLAGVFQSSDFDAVVGDSSVLMESSLRAEATLRPQGPNNDIRVVATSSGSLFNGIQFLFVDDGSQPENGAVATFSGTTNRMTIRIESGITTANQVIAALNAQGTFSASLVPEVDAPNNGTGPIQATRFFASGGAVEVPASATLRMVGSDNDVVLTAKELGDDQNGYEIRIVSDSTLSPGQVVVQHQSTERRILLNMNPAFTSAAAVESAVNAVSSLPFTADAGGSVGTIVLANYPATSGGSGATARADFVATGTDNDFEVVANEAIPSLVNIRVFLIDDGSITDGSASSAYFTDTRYLIVNLQSGVTTASTVIAAINDNANVPVTATLLSGNNGSGVYFIETADFSGGIEAIAASAGYTLPAGPVVEVLADEGGVSANGLQVSFAIDSRLDAGTASANYFESGGIRILQLRVADAGTPLEVLRDALASAEDIPYSLIVDAADLSSGLGFAAVMDGESNEGGVILTVEGSIYLKGRIQSQTGRVELTTTNSDLVFDSEFARIEAIDGVDISVSGNFVNAASLEQPLITVYGSHVLSIETGSQSTASTEALHLRSYGDIEIFGAGLAIEDAFNRERPVLLDAEGSIVIDAEVNVVATDVDAQGLVFEIIKSETDALGEDLTASNPVDIVEDNGTILIYVLPGVATHADIVSALNAYRINDLQVFFSSLGRQQGTLTFAGHTFYLTAVDSDVINVVNIGFADLGSEPLAAEFSGTTLSITLGAFDNATVADLVAALNQLSSFTASTSSADTSVLLRGANARDFIADYTLEIVSATEDAEGNPLTGSNRVSIHEDNGSFTIYALAGVATRLDIQSALSASGLFGASVPVLNAELQVGDVVYYINTGTTSVTGVDLEFGFVEEGLVELDVTGETLGILLNNIDAVTGQDLLDALQAFGFTVYTFESDLETVFDVEHTEAVFTAIPSSDRNAPLDLAAPVVATLPVGSDGVFAVVKIEIDGMLLFVNWRVPVLTAAFESTTATENRSALIEDNGSAPSVTMEYGSVGRFASAILIVDGVELSIAARSSEIIMRAGQQLLLSEDSQVSGGTVQLESGDFLAMAGSILGGSLNAQAHGIIVQPGSIQVTGTAGVTVSSLLDSIYMSGDGETLTESGNVLYQAAGRVTLAYIATSGGGRIDINVGLDIIDANQDDELNLSTSGLITLTAQTGIGSIEEGAIQTSSGQLLLRNFGSSGDIVVTEVASGGTLNLIELTQNAIEGWSILRALGGDVLISGPVLHLNDGSFFVEAAAGLETTTEGSIDLNGGSLSVLVEDGSVSLNADLSTNGGDVLILVNYGGLIMLPSITLDAAGGSILLGARFDIELAQLRTSDGAILIDSIEGSVVRSANDGRTNLIAQNLLLSAGLSIGDLSTADAALITDVDYLAVAARAGALALRELNDLEIGSVTVHVGVGSPSKDVIGFSYGQEQSTVTPGNSVIRVGGSLTVNTIDGSDPTFEVDGNLLIDAGNSISVIGDLIVTSGSIEMVSGNDFNLDGSLSVSGGTLLIQAGASFVQGLDSSLSVTDNHAAIVADQSITLNYINTGDGYLALTALAGGINRNADAPATQLVAEQLRIQSSAAVGNSTDVLVVDVNRMSALAVDSMHLRAVSAMSVDAVDVSVATVSINGSTATDPDWVESVQSDLRSSGGGNILLSVDAELTLQDGHNDDGTAVQVAAAGKIHLSATSLIANANIESDAGPVTVIASGDAAMTSGAEVHSNDGDLFVQVGENLSMHDLARMVTQSGNVGIVVGGNFSIANVEAPSGYVLIQTSGSLMDAGESQIDIVADRLQIESGAGVGTLSAGSVGYDSIEILANRISATVANGPFAISAEAELEVGMTSGEVIRVEVDGTSTSAFDNDDALYGIQSIGGGSVSLVVNEGLTLLAGANPSVGIQASNAGNVVLNAATITLRADVDAETGHITLQSTNALVLGEDTTVSTGGNGSVSILSDSGSISQEAGSLVSSVDGDIVFSANNSIAVAFISTSANVSVRSASGSITDVEPDHVNIEAAALRLYAQVSIGSGSNPLDTEVDSLSARTLNGGVFLSEGSDLAVTTTTAVTWVVAADNTLTQTVVGAQSGIVTGGSNGTVSLLVGGTVAVADPVSASQSGRILVSADGSLQLQANVSSGSGSITFESDGAFTMASEVTVTTAGSGEIHVFAGTEIQTVANSRFINAAGNIVLSTTGDLVLGGIESAARVALTSSEGSILSAGSSNFDYEVIATRLLLSAAEGGVGTLFPEDPVNLFRTQVNRIAAEAGAGGINVRNDGNTLVDVVSLTYRTVNSNGSLSNVGPALSLSDLTTLAGGGSIVLRSASGNITLMEGSNANGASVSAHGSGRIRIETESAGGDITINADVLSGGGSISILGDGSVYLNANVLSQGSNDIDIMARDGSLEMHAESVAETGGLLALRAGSNISLGSVTAARVYVSAGAAIVNSGVASINITASDLQLLAGLSIGQPVGTGNGPILTAVDLLGLSTGDGSVYIIEQDGLLLTRISPINVQRVTAAAAIEIVDGQVLVGEQEVNGDTVIEFATSSEGDLTVDETFTSFGSFNLFSDDGNVFILAPVISENGNISVDAFNSIFVSDQLVDDGAGGTVRVIGFIRAAGTVDLLARNGSIFMGEDTFVETDGSNIRAEAANNIRFDKLDARTVEDRTGAEEAYALSEWGSVSIIANSGSVAAIGPDRGLTKVYADALSLQAGTSIGEVDNFKVLVNTFAARAGSNIWVQSLGSVEVGTVADVQIQRVTREGIVFTYPETPATDLSGITTTALNGSIYFEVLSGDLNVSAPVATNGTGKLRFNVAEGSATFNSAITVGGAVSLLVYGDVQQNSSFEMNGSRSVDLESLTGSITMVDGASASAATQLRYRAPGNITVGSLSAERIRLNTDGSILDGGDSDLDLVAQQAQLTAGGSIGQSNGTGMGFLNTNITYLAASAEDGIFIADESTLTVGSVAAVQPVRIASDGTETIITGSSLSGLASSGPVLVTALTGLNIVQAVTVSGSYNLLLQTLGGSADLVVQAPVETAGGHISIIAGRSLVFEGSGSVQTTAGGSVDIEALSGSIQQQAALTVLTGGGNILLRAEGDISLGVLNATANGRVGVQSNNGSILDSKSRTATSNNIVANAVSLMASGNIGLIGQGVDNALEISATTLTAQTTEDGSIHISALALRVDTVSAFSVNRVAEDASTSTTSTTVSEQSDVRTAGNGNIVLRSAVNASLNGGLADDYSGIAVSTAGSGNILIHVTTGNSGLTANAAIQSGSGNISIRTGNRITLAGSGDIRVLEGSGTIDLDAGIGTILQSANLVVQTDGGNISLRGNGNISIGVLDARTNADRSSQSLDHQGDWGAIGIQTSGVIQDNKPSNATAINLYASRAILIAANGIGHLNGGTINAIETELRSLAAVSSNGVLNIHESTDLSIETIASFATNRVAQDATTASGSTTFSQQAGLSVGSDLRIVSANGSIAMEDGVTASSATSVYFSAEADVVIGGIFAPQVRLLAGASIISAGAATLDVVTDYLQLLAGASVGEASGVGGGFIHVAADSIAAVADSGDIYLRNDGDLTLAEVEFTQPGLGTVSMNGLAAGSSISLWVDGSLTINQAITATDGDLRISNSAGSILADAELTAGQHLSIEAAESLSQNANFSAVGTLFVRAVSGSVEMDLGTLSTGESVRYEAEGSITIAAITAFEGVAVVSHDGGLTALAGVNLTAERALLDVVQSIGSAGAALDVVINYLALESAADVFIRNDAELEIGTVAVSVNAIQTDASLESVDGTLSGMESSGQLTLVNSEGLLIRQSVSVGGDLLLQASSVTAEANLEFEGDANVLASDSIALDAAVLGAGSLLIEAATGVLTMTSGSSIEAAATLLKAFGTLTVATISADLVILETDEGNLVALSGQNITAESLALSIGGSVATENSRLEIEVDSIAIVAGGDTFISQSGSLELSNIDWSFRLLAIFDSIAESSESGSLSDIDVDGLLDLEIAGSFSMQSGRSIHVVGALTFAAEGAVSLTQLEAASIAIQSENGNITLQESLIAHSGGSILLEALSGSLELNGSVTTGTGHITLKASGSIQLQSTEIQTGQPGTISIKALTGAITQFGNSSIDATGSSLRMAAAGSITVGNLVAANVSISSGAAIVNASGSSLNVSANILRLEADQSIGASSRHLSLSVQQLAARSASGSIFLSEASAITVAAVSVTVTEVSFAGNTTTVTDSSLSGLQTGANGHIVLESATGNVSLNNAVSAQGSGNIRIAAASGNLAVGSSVQSGTGHITLRASGSLSIAAVTVRTSSAGHVSLSAGDGSLTMIGGSQVEAVNSTLRISSSGNLSLGNLTATHVSLISTGGSILNASGTQLNVTAQNLRLQAQGNIGVAARRLTIDASLLSAHSNSSGIFLTESNSVTVGSVSVSYTEVSGTGSTSSQTDLSQAGLRTQSNGRIQLNAVDGDLTVNAEVVAQGSGQVLLRTSSSSADISIAAAINAGTGRLTLLAGQNLNLSANLSSDGGDAFLRAESGSFVQSNGSISVGSGDIRIEALGDVILRQILSGGTLFASSSEGSIQSMTYQPSNPIVISGSLRLEAGDRIGTVEGGALLVRANRIQASTQSGELNIAVLGDTTIGSVGLSVERALADGSSETVNYPVVSDRGLSAGSNLLLGSNSDLVIENRLEASGAIVVNADGWLRHNLAAAGPVMSAEIVVLNAGAGLGRTGSGALWIETDELNAISETGSIYLAFDSDTSIAVALVRDLGSVFIRQSAGDLNIEGVVAAFGGGVNIRTVGGLVLDDSGVLANGGIDVLAQSIVAEGSEIASVTGNIRIRSAGGLSLDAESSVVATLGAIYLQSANELEVSTVEAQGQLQLIAGGSVLSNAAGDSDKAIRGEDVRIRAGGSIGSGESPLIVDSERLDLEAGDGLNLRSLSGLSVGAYGLSVETQAGETLRIEVAGGALSSNGGTITDRGTGTFVLESSGTLEINTLVRSVGGSIRIVAERITHNGSASAVIEAPQGGIELVAQSGIGSESNPLYFLAPDIRAYSTTGILNLYGLGSTRIGGEGVWIGGGNGLLQLRLASGNLSVHSDLRHFGSGRMRIEVLAGSLQMNASGHISTTTGNLNIVAQSDIRVARIGSANGNIVMESLGGSIRRIDAAITGGNLISARSPVLRLVGIAELTVDADVVNVNGSDIFRRNAPFIQLYLVFSS